MNPILPRVRVSGPPSEDLLQLFRHSSFEATTDRVDPAYPGPKVLVAFRPPTDETLAHYDWVHVAGAGSDKVAAFLRRDGANPILTRTVGKMGEQIGEYVLSYILADLQKYRVRQDLQTRSQWSIADAQPRCLFDTRVAILGTGGVAQGIASMLKSLAKEVLGYSKSGTERDPFDAVRQLDNFQPTDIVINALPGTEQTESLCNDAFFGRMDQALFINIGRGRTVDDEALLRALEQGTVRHAVLDVFREEPLPVSSPFWDHPNITVTPHVSGITRWEDTAEAFFSYWPAFAGGTLRSTVSLDRGY